MKYLVVGLGNEGTSYKRNRHNIGFLTLDTFAQKYQSAFDIKKLASHTSFRIKNKTVHLIKPNTYMNLSGKAVSYWSNHLKIEKENLMVIVDDVVLDFGQLRIRKSGSHGGHNGLKNIEAFLGGQHFARIRFGIGNNYKKGRQADYVLEDFNEEEEKTLPEKINHCIEAIETLILQGIDSAMNTYNAKTTN